MNNVQIFSTPEFGEIRTAGDHNNPLFCLADVCKALGLSTNGITRRLSKGVISNHPLSTSGGMQMSLFVTEDGLYDVILDSRKPEAKAFRKWITFEVLPNIRKHGAYLTPEKIEEVLLNPDTIITLASALKKEQNERLRLEEQRKNDAPKVLLAKAIENSDELVLVAELAKIITQAGIRIGQNSLYKWFRENGYLCSKGSYRNQPTQKTTDMKLFKITKQAIEKGDGSEKIVTTTKVTGKGIAYFTNKVIKEQK